MWLSPLPAAPVAANSHSKSSSNNNSNNTNLGGGSAPAITTTTTATITESICKNDNNSYHIQSPCCNGSAVIKITIATSAAADAAFCHAAAIISCCDGFNMNPCCEWFTRRPPIVGKFSVASIWQSLWPTINSNTQCCCCVAVAAVAAVAAALLALRQGCSQHRCYRY